MLRVNVGGRGQRGGAVGFARGGFCGFVGLWDRRPVKLEKGNCKERKSAKHTFLTVFP